jgi:hypothetical protein
MKIAKCKILEGKEQGKRNLGQGEKAIGRKAVSQMVVINLSRWYSNFRN